MITAEKLIELKNKVKTEIDRRSYYGSDTISKFSSQTFETTPKQGEPILAEQGKKIIEPLLNICDKGDLNLDKLEKGEKIPSSFNEDLISYVDTLSKESTTASTSSCRGACTGLCVGTCGSSCGGCSSSCGSSCEGSCSKTCGSSCGGCSSSSPSRGSTLRCGGCRLRHRAGRISRCGGMPRGRRARCPCPSVG